jgi:hypothetical protein
VAQRRQRKGFGAVAFDRFARRDLARRFKQIRPASVRGAKS